MGVILINVFVPVIVMNIFIMLWSWWLLSLLYVSDVCKHDFCKRMKTSDFDETRHVYSYCGIVVWKAKFLPYSSGSYKI